MKIIDSASLLGLVRIETNACPSCSQTGIVTVPKAEWDAWQRGEHIQTAMPFVSADDRERLISGTCGPCFDEMFADDEEEDGFYCPGQGILVNSMDENGNCPECRGELF